MSFDCARLPHVELRNRTDCLQGHIEFEHNEPRGIPGGGGSDFGIGVHYLHEKRMAPEVAKAIQEAIYAKTIEREEAKEGRRGRTSRRLDCRPDCRWQRGAVHEDARRGPIPGPWGPYRDPYKGPFRAPNRARSVAELQGVV